jgi:uncharacterized protein YsxB (DUF464 family)
MTSITAYDLKLKNGKKLYIIQASRHATGSSSVCAAISGILYALAGYLRNSTDTDVKCLELKKGEAKIIFTGNENAYAVYQMAAIGLAQIAASYPEYAKFNKNFKKT